MFLYLSYCLKLYWNDHLSAYIFTYISNSFHRRDFYKWHYCTNLHFHQFSYLNIVDAQYYVIFRCNTEWFDICIHYEMITSLVTICPPKSYYNIIDHISYAVHYIPMAYLFYNWKFLPLNPVHPSLSSPLAITHLFSVFMSVFILFCFLMD